MNVRDFAVASIDLMMALATLAPFLRFTRSPTANFATVATTSVSGAGELALVVV